MFKPIVVEVPVYVEVSLNEFQDIVDRNWIYDEVDEINIIFVSDPKDITLQHYLEQPRSMLSRKLERIFVEKTLGVWILMGSQIALDIWAFNP